MVRPLDQPDIGLYFLRARYMDTDRGRFWSMDVWEGESCDPPGLHKYTYCRVDPVGRIDPSGLLSLVEQMILVDLLDLPIEPPRRPGRIGVMWKAKCSSYSLSHPLAGIGVVLMQCDLVSGPWSSGGLACWRTLAEADARAFVYAPGSILDIQFSALAYFTTPDGNGENFSGVFSITGGGGGFFLHYTKGEIIMGKAKSDWSGSLSFGAGWGWNKTIVGSSEAREKGRVKIDREYCNGKKDPLTGL